jgi:acetate kinase
VNGGGNRPVDARGPHRILVVNAGSSSLKLRVLDEGDQTVGGADLPVLREGAGGGDIAGAIASFGPLDAVGHRIVHGGDDFRGPVLIDDGVERRLRALSDLAPLHQPQSLAALDAVRRVIPDLPAVACFDTAFHAAMPAAASTYALPPEWRRRWNLRRYGFHGLSHAYASRKARELLALARSGSRLVTCHLGAGASLAAVEDGRSVDTTMGFTPLEGLVMATRSGSIDPGLVLWLEEHAGMPPAALAATLERRSGLFGLAGTADMREILARERGGDRDAVLAVAVFLHRLRASIAAMAAAMNGLDALVFTGGIGENSAEIRARAAAGLRFLGVEIDADGNEGGVGDREIGAPGAAVRSLVVAAREDLEIVHEVRRVLADSAVAAA